MRTVTIGSVVLLFAMMTSPSNADQGLKAAYQTFTAGAGRAANNKIASACMRLINNSAKKNQLVGFLEIIA